MSGDGLNKIGNIMKMTSVEQVVNNFMVSQTDGKISGSTFGNGIIDNKGMGVTLEDDPKKKYDGETTVDEMLQAYLNKYYMDHSNEILDALMGENDSVKRTIKYKDRTLGLNELEVEFVKSANGEISYKYNLGYTQYNGMTIPQGQKGLDEGDQKRYDELAKKIVDPTISNKDRKNAEKELEALIEKQYGALDKIVMEGDKERRIPMYTKNELNKIKYGVIADIKQEAEFEGTTVYYKLSDKLKADRELKKEQDAVRAKLKKGEQLSEEEIKTLRKQNTIMSSDAAAFVDKHKELFFNGDEFDSDMFKAFARGLTGDDTKLTVAERREKWNMFQMRANEKTRKAQERIDNGTATEADRELVRKAMRPGWFNDAIMKDGLFTKDNPIVLDGPNRYANGETQRDIVRAAGLKGNYDYKPLLTVASIAMAVAAPYVGSALTKITSLDVDLSIQNKIANLINVDANTITDIIFDEAANCYIVNTTTNGAIHVTTKLTNEISGFVSGSIQCGAPVSGIMGALGGAGAVASGKPAANNGGKGNEVKPEDKILAGQGQIKDPCEPCEPCDEGDGVTPPDPNGGDKPPVNNKDCDCQDVIKIVIPKAKKIGSVEVNGTTVDKYEGFLDRDILDCFRVAEGQSQAAGSAIPRSQMKEFIKAFRREKLGSERAYLKPGEQEMCTEFTFNGVTYKFDMDLFNELLKHPRQYNGGGKNIKAAKVKDIPC